MMEEMASEMGVLLDCGGNEDSSDCGVWKAARRYVRCVLGESVWLWLLPGCGTQMQNTPICICVPLALSAVFLGNGGIPPIP